jgi:DNA-binding CsgD family transcriptional regulator/DNA-binding MarR family transcriptional regulator
VESVSERGSLDLAHAYATLLERPDLTLREFALVLDCDDNTARALLNRLAEMSLLQRRENETANAFVAVSPVVAMHELIAREHRALAERQEFLRESYHTLSQLLPGYVGQENATARPQITEVIRDLPSVRRRLEELALGARSEVLSLSPIPANPSATRAASRSLDLDTLNRGIQMRTIYPDIAVYDTGALAYAEELTAAGGEIRIARELPLRLLIVDRRTALVPMNPDDSTEGCLVIYHLGTVVALTALFESCWQASWPLTGDQDEAGSCSVMERAVLTLLACGTKDEAVARQLSLSVRTLRRCIADLMIRAGATSRFELGAQAVARGWL